MNVLWLTNIPSPYRVNFFNEFGKYCNLTVLFELKNASDRDKSWEKFNCLHFKSVFLNGYKYGSDKALCLSTFKYIKNYANSKIIVTNFSDLTGIIAILYMKLKK